MSAKQAKVATRLATPTPTKLPLLWSEAEGGLYMPPDPSVPLLVVALVPAALRKQIEKQFQHDEEKKMEKQFDSPTHLISGHWRKARMVLSQENRYTTDYKGIR
jgi:hypothetical protein